MEGLPVGAGGGAAGEVENASVVDPALGFEDPLCPSAPELRLSFAVVAAAALDADVGVGWPD